MNNSLARNKLSCTLDPRRPEALELFMRLVERSDLVVENLKTKTLHSIGIHETQLLERNPRLLVLRVPGAGLTGDWANFTGFGGQFDGLSGLAFLTGHHGSAMVETPGTTYSDIATGPAGAFAVLAALHYRAATGRGQVIELAQIENVLAQLGDVFVETQLVGEGEKLGNRDPLQAPQGIYACRGEHAWLAITVADDDQWIALTKVLGAPGLADDARFVDVHGRYQHHDELDTVISAWAATQDVTEAFHTLQAAGIAAAPSSTTPSCSMTRTWSPASGSVRSRPPTSTGRTPTSAMPSRASPRPGPAAHRRSARTTSTSTATSSGSTPTSTRRSWPRASPPTTTSTPPATLSDASVPWAGSSPW